jgi:hypothetical protein
MIVAGSSSPSLWTPKPAHMHRDVLLHPPTVLTVAATAVPLALSPARAHAGGREHVRGIPSEPPRRGAGAALRGPCSRRQMRSRRATGCWGILFLARDATRFEVRPTCHPCLRSGPSRAFRQRLSATRKLAQLTVAADFTGDAREGAEGLTGREQATGDAGPAAASCRAVGGGERIGSHAADPARDDQAGADLPVIRP